MAISLNSEQKSALEILEGHENVFLTGAAGSGKSFLVRHFLKYKDPKTFPVLASTGAAAILVGGRTFHSFFGVGILEGGAHETVARALKNKRLKKRLNDTRGVIIDEVSMLSGTHLWVAERICRKLRDNDEPWGGLQVICVGDFSQLPPVNVHGTEKDWAFLDPVWENSHFVPVVLSKIVRSSDHDFIRILNFIREGITNEDVTQFLNARSKKPPSKTSNNLTRLFARRDAVERFNLERLSGLKGETRTFTTTYTGKDTEIEKFRKNSPIPDVLMLKEDALVMMRQNDVEGRWVNGSLGHIRGIDPDELLIELLSGREIQVERADFTLLNADGKPVVIANNFPLTLAWAMTIHKAQGATLDRMQVDLRSLWEPGQAYVALSRVQSPEGLYIEGWHPRSIMADPAVHEFHEKLQQLGALPIEEDL